MPLAYLLFDSSDEDGGHCSFDAMASVLPDRLPALLREVEAVLEAHPAVREAAVHGRPDPEWGEAIVATVVLEGEATPAPGTPACASRPA